MKQTWIAVAALLAVAGGTVTVLAQTAPPAQGQTQGPRGGEQKMHKKGGEGRPQGMTGPRGGGMGQPGGGGGRRGGGQRPGGR